MLFLAHPDSLVELQLLIVILLCIEWVESDLVVLHLGHDLDRGVSRI